MEELIIVFGVHLGFLVVAVGVQFVILRMKLSSYELQDHSKQALANRQVDNEIERKYNFNIYSLIPDSTFNTLNNSVSIQTKVYESGYVPEQSTVFRSKDGLTLRNYTPDKLYIFGVKSTASATALYVDVLSGKCNYLILAGYAVSISVNSEMEKMIIESTTMPEQNDKSKTTIFLLTFPPDYDQVVPGIKLPSGSHANIVTFLGSSRESIDVYPYSHVKDQIERLSVLHAVGYRV